ncbi:hypothetical protein MHYP_G00201290 [Metynnis hypsauchen]
MEDGSVIGDPANVEFTELGWTPKYGLFDVLPLVLQANGADPELFEIPPELILKVQMEHPQYEWFKDLNLRWYAVPAVANMLLEIGCLEFTACPFNGWYMGTEIGVRDFCDSQRYNILERAGHCMGLETHRLSSLWKDEALVAINVAVIHSFQFDSWLTYVWKDEKRRSIKRKRISFKGLIRAVVFSQTLMQKALERRVSCTILCATETGKSQTFAKKLKSVLNCAFNPRLLCMEDYDFHELEKKHLLMVVTSTFGNGDCPGNGTAFSAWVSRMYPQFCAFAHAVDDKLSELGAKRVAAIGEGDELNGQEEAFSAWACTAFKAVCKEFGIEGQLSGAEHLTDSWEPQKHRVQPDSSTLDHISSLTVLHSKTVFPMKLKRRKNLQRPQSRCSTILVELQIDEGKDILNYAPGEHVDVFPGNSPELVTGILKHLADTPSINQSLRLQYLPVSCLGGEKWQTDSRIPACPLAKALTYFLDITTPPSQSFLRKLSQMTKQEDDR